MQSIIKIRNSFIQWAAFSAIVLGSALCVAADDSDKVQPPQLPAVCGAIQVPAGNTLSFHTYAVGFQLYRWSGGRWNFVAPSAKLFADENYRAPVGDHFAGPTWQSSNGSSVVAARVEGCTPDAAAIPWLLLRSVSTGGKGVFSKTTFIQRTNTGGGLEPSSPGSFEGDQRKVPYVAEYYFYEADSSKVK